MERYITQQHPLNIIEPLPINLGGTNAKTAQQALNNLSAVPAPMIGEANGVTPLDSNVKIPPQFLPASDINSVSVTGPGVVISGQQTTYQITDYDFDTQYTITSDHGTIIYNQSTDADQFKFVASATPAQQHFTINGTIYPVTVQTPEIQKPIILKPFNGATNDGLTIDIHCSAYVINGSTDACLKSEWDFSDDVNFTAPFRHDEKTTGTLSHHRLSAYGNELPLNKSYYVRMRYTSVGLLTSPWSDPVHVVTRTSNLPMSETNTLNRSKLLSDINLRYKGEFGTSVSTNAAGDVLAIGLCDTDDETANYKTGGVYIYKFDLNADDWVCQQIIQESDAVNNSPHSSFADSIHLSNDGNVLIIAERFSKNTVSGNYGSHGQIYIYKTSTPNNFSTFTLINTILPPSDNEPGLFAKFMAVSADCKTIAATHNNSGDGYGDQVILYKFDNLSQPPVLTHGFILPCDWISINDDGTKLIVNNTKHNDNEIVDVGSVTCFELNGNDWVLKQIITAATPSQNALFGFPCVISGDGNVIIIADNYSRLFFYVIENDAWTLKHTIVYPATDQVATDLKTSFDGSYVLAGFSNMRIPAQLGGPSDWEWNGTGGAFLYKRNVNTWDKVQELYASDYMENANFGYAVAMNDIGSMLAVCAPYNSGGIYDQLNGGVYIFS